MNEDKKEFFVTAAETLNYIDGVLCLNESLKFTGTKHKLICLIARSISSESLSNKLKQSGIIEIIVDDLRYVDKLQSPKNWARHSAIKGNLFLMDESYDKLIYIDCDMCAFDNLDSLFDFPIGSAAYVKTKEGVFGAHSCMFSYKPNKEFGNLFKFLIETYSDSYDGFLIGALYGMNMADSKRRIPNDVYAVVLNSFNRCNRTDIKLAHFCSSAIKPWMLSEKELDDFIKLNPCMAQYKKYLLKIRGGKI